MKTFIQSYWKWIAVLAGLLAVYLLWGGITLSIRNQSAYDICDVYYALEPIENEGGKNLLRWGRLNARQSRDFNMPQYLTWFKNPNDTIYVRSVGCSGEIMDYWEQDITESSFFMREIR